MTEKIDAMWPDGRAATGEETLLAHQALTHIMRLPTKPLGYWMSSLHMVGNGLAYADEDPRDLLAKYRATADARDNARAQCWLPTTTEALKESLPELLDAHWRDDYQDLRGVIRQHFDYFQERDRNDLIKGLRIVAPQPLPADGLERRLLMVQQLATPEAGHLYGAELEDAYFSKLAEDLQVRPYRADFKEVFFARRMEAANLEDAVLVTPVLDLERGKDMYKAVFTRGPHDLRLAAARCIGIFFKFEPALGLEVYEVARVQNNDVAAVAARGSLRYVLMNPEEYPLVHDEGWDERLRIMARRPLGAAHAPASNTTAGP